MRHRLPEQSEQLHSPFLPAQDQQEGNPVPTYLFQQTLIPQLTI